MNARTRVRLITVAVSLVLTLGVLGILRVVAVEAAQTAPLAHTAGVRLGAGQAISVTRVSPATLSHLTTATASPAGWTTECADCPKYFETLTDRSLRRDSAGYPAIAYGGDHLYYAHHDGSVWQFTTVDSNSTVGRYASLALDGSNYPHISYYDTANGDLKYAYQDGSGWYIQTVDSGGDVGSYTSVALDGNGDPHISYHDNTNDTLKYAYQDGSGWHSQTVDNASGEYTSLVVDGNGYAHISHHGIGLKYTYQDSGGWHTKLVESITHLGMSVGTYTSLALDSSGYAHISYSREDDALSIPYSLKYAYQNASGWYSQTVDAYKYGVGTTSIALASNTYAHIAYTLGGQCVNGTCDSNHLSYAYQDGSGWNTRLTNPNLTLDNGANASIDLNGGYPRISYLNGLVLKYAYQDAGGWHLQPVDTAADVGSGTSIRLDSGDAVHISYAGPAGLKYAYRDASTWHTQTVDGGEYLGTALALDGAEEPHIGYGGWDDLRYADQGVSSWITQTLVSGDAYALGTSLALDTNEYARLTYVNGAGLFYVYQDNSGWHSENPDSIGSYLYDGTSLVLDGNDYPHVSYYYGNDGDLRYAYKDGAGWHVLYMSGAAGTINSHTSLALDANEYPHISFYDSSNGYLKYLYQDASGWWITTVDSTGDVGDYSSLVLDADGYPHISYYDKTNGDLKYAYEDASSWYIQTIDDTGNVGQYTSLVLDSNDYPHISYFDVSNRDLKHAFYAPPAGVPTLLAPSNGTLTITQAITLVWQAGAGGTPLGYNVQLDGRTITTTQTTSSTILSLGAHTWSVRAYNANGYSDWAAAWSIAITQPVAIPILLTPPSESLSLHNVTFVWQAGVGSAPIGYNLQVDGSVITTTNPPSATILSNGLHTWTARAYNAFGYSAWVTPAWTFEVTDTLPAPNTPILLAPLNGTITTSQAINLVWQWGTGAIPLGYNVQIDSGQIVTVTGTTSATILSKGFHVWTVRAYNSVGYSAWATPWSIEVRLPNTVCLPLILRGP